MQVTLTIRDDGCVHGRLFRSRSEADREVLRYVNEGLDEDARCTDVEGAIEFLTLHGCSVRILEYHPKDD